MKQLCIIVNNENKPKYLRNKKIVAKYNRVLRGNQTKNDEIVRWYIEEFFSED